MNKKQLSLLIITLFILLGGTFYWFQWRPTQIRKNCYAEAKEKAISLLGKKVADEPSQYSDMAKTGNYFLKDDFQFYYQNCLIIYGLEK